MGQWLNLPKAVAVPAVPNANPSQAPSIAPVLQTSFSPTSPQLGDTLQVLIRRSHQTNTLSLSPAPQITWDKKVYPAFLLKSGSSTGNDRNGKSGDIDNDIKNNGVRNVYVWRALIPTTPLDVPGPKQLVINHGESPHPEINFTLSNREFPTQSLWIDESGNSLEPTDAEWDQVSAFKKIVTPQKMWQGKFLRPNEGEVTTGFGVRRYYNGVFATDYYHRGVDYGGGYGSPVIAPAAGVVRLVGHADQGFRLHGNTVGIDHGQGVLSIFLHLSKITVQPGESVVAGQIIGEVGSTGAATGPHLHWGLYVQGESVDPAPWRYGDIE